MLMLHDKMGQRDGVENASLQDGEPPDSDTVMVYRLKNGGREYGNGTLIFA